MTSLPNWTHEEIEARLIDYLEGVLQPEEQRAFDVHHFHLRPGASRCSPAFRICSPIFIPWMKSSRRPEPHLRHPR